MNRDHPLAPSGALRLPGGNWHPGLPDLDNSLDTVPRFVDAAEPAASTRLSLETEPVRPPEVDCARALLEGGSEPDRSAGSPPWPMPGGAYAWPVRVGNLTLVEKVHQGRMSAVWRATDEAGQTWAVKLVPRSLAPNADEQSLARLVQISAHPGLVTLVQHGIQDQWWYQIAEWVEGDTLQSRLHAAHSLADAIDLRLWMRQVASALEELHRAGFLHGDVKPSNVLVSGSRAVLIDLAGLRIGTVWTRQGGLTPAFASPEARRGAPSDPRDDIYSLTAMIVQLLTGELVDPARGVLPAAPPPTGLSASEWRILRAALQPGRAYRAGSAIGLVDALWPDLREPESAPPPMPGRWAAAPVVPAGRVSPGSYGWGGAVMAAMAVLLLGAKIGQNDLPGSGSGSVVASGTVWRQPFAEANFIGAGVFHAVTALVARDAAPNLRPVPEPPVAESLLAVPAGRVDAPPVQDLLATPEAPSLQSSVMEAVTVAAERTLAAVPVRLELPERYNVAALPERPSAVVIPERPEVPTELARPEVPDVPARPDVPVVPTLPEIPTVPARPEVPTKPDVPAVSARPDVPVVPTLPDIPAVPARPDVPVVPARPELPAVPARPDIPVVPTLPDIPAVPARPDVPGVPARPDIPAVPARPDIPVVPALPDIPAVPARPDVPVVPARPDIPAVPARPDIPVVPALPDIPALPVRPDIPAIPARPDIPDRPERPSRPDRPERPERR